MNTTTKIRHGDCENCGTNKRATVKAKEPWSQATEDWQHWQEHYLLECGGCGRIYYQRVSTNSEDWDYDAHGEMELNESIENWPRAPSVNQPDWLRDLNDPDLYLILGEVYGAIGADLGVLSVIGMRTALDRVSELLGVDPALTFEQKVSALQKDGHIGSKETSDINTIIGAGSAAAHRGWRPSALEIKTLLTTLEAFIYRTLIGPKRMRKVQQSVPARPRKRGDVGKRPVNPGPEPSKKA